MTVSIAPAALSSVLDGQMSALLDVRDAGEYERGHIPGATSLPRRDIEFRVTDLVPVRSTPVVLCDGGDGRAALAVATLAELGYTDTRVLEGGVPAWAEGRRLESGVNVPSKHFGEWVHVHEHVPEIAPEELAPRLASAEPPLILDVRTPEEHQRARIPGSVCVPNGELVLLAGDLRRHPGRPVVVHCAGRTRSLIGAQTLRDLGVADVKALRNGTMGWQLAGLTLEKGVARPAPAPTAESRAEALALARAIHRAHPVTMLGVAAFKALRAEADRRTVYVFDVRSEAEYESSHVPGSLWVAGGQAVQRTDDFVAVRGAAIVFVCDGDGRSLLTATWFRRMGFAQAAVLEGGVPAWVTAGEPLERGKPRPSVPALVAARALVPPMDVPGLAARLGERGLVVLDVSTSLQHERRHVPGARWVSRGWLESAATAAIADRDTAIVVTCANGEQSALAAATLVRLGYRRVSRLDGGVRAWTAASRPTAIGMDAPLVEPNDIALLGLARGEEAAMRKYLEWETALVPHGEGR